MEMFDLTIFKLGAGLLLLIVANISLGSVAALIERTWDWKKFWNGVIKGAAIVVALMAVYFAGYLNPDLLVIETGGQTVNLMTAVYVVLMAAFAAYAIDILKKLKDMLMNATPGSEQGYLLQDVVEDDTEQAEQTGEKDDTENEPIDLYIDGL